MPNISDDVADLLLNAMDDGVPCLLGTVSADGTPQISPKGSFIVYDKTTLAFWERANRTSIANVAANPRVVVYYRNAAQADRLPQGAALRFYGNVRTSDDEAVRQDIYNRMNAVERKADPDCTGTAVLIDVDRVTDLRGNEQQA